MLYSAPHYDYARLSTKIENNGTTLIFRLQKPLFTRKYEEVAASGKSIVYDGGWNSIYGTSYEISSFEQIEFGGKVIWTDENTSSPIPDYVFAYDEFHSGSDWITAWLCAVDEGYVGAKYADGTTVLWDLDGNVISS